MEQSLKEEPCTIDDAAAFIDDINAQYFRKPVGFEQSRELADFLINVVLGNEGKTMHFQGYDFDTKTWNAIPVSYIANRVVYIDSQIRRTSYYLTDDGYSLMLGTLEVESNLKLTIQEMIFKMHLEKQSYDRALEDIKNVFNLLRIQLQKIQETMTVIRRNALAYSVEDYEKLLQENMDTIDSTSEKFKGYRMTVQTRIQEFEQSGISAGSLNAKDEENLKNLQEIEKYLGRTIDEYQAILNRHFDLKSLYSSELERMAQMSLIERFDLRNDIFEKVLSRPQLLENMDIFLHPLFSQNPDRIFNPALAFSPQQIKTADLQEEDEQVLEEFDEDEWKAQQEKAAREKENRYRSCLLSILDHASEKGTALSKIAAQDLENLVPDIETFKEVMVELIKAQTVNLDALKAERASFLQQESSQFSPGMMILAISEEYPQFQTLQSLQIARLSKAKPVVITQRPDGKGGVKNVRCSDIKFTAVYRKNLQSSKQKERETEKGGK
jgi:hypothetical protein